MVITYILFLLIHTIDKTYSKPTEDKTIPPIIKTATMPLLGIDYDDTRALVIIEKKTYTLTQDGTTTPFTSIPSDSTVSFSAGLYRIDDNHYATICRNFLITIYNKANNVIFNSTITDYYLFGPCVMKKINLSNYLILSYNQNNTVTMHIVTNSTNSWNVTSSKIIKDTKNNEIKIGMNAYIQQYDIESINPTLLLFSYMDYTYYNIKIIGINQDGINTTNTTTLPYSSYSQSRLFRLNDTTVLLLSIKDKTKIAIKTMDYTTDPITFNDERDIDTSLSSIAFYTIANIQDNIIELFCGGASDGQSYIQYDHLLNLPITHIKYSALKELTFYPNIIILKPSISIMLLFNQNRNKNYIITFPCPKCKTISFNSDVKVFLSAFGIVNMKSILFFDINNTKNPPTITGNGIMTDTNYSLTSSDFIIFNNHSICKYDYSINQQIDNKCDITVNNCKLLCDIENCAICPENNLSNCTSCETGYYYYEDKPSGTLTACYKSCKEVTLPLNLFQHEELKKCYINCSEIGKKNDLKNNECVTDCDSGIEYDSTLNNCGSKCVCLARLISNTFIGGEYNLILCGVLNTSECKECGLLRYNKTNTCVKQCPKCYKSDLFGSDCVFNFAFFPTVQYNHTLNTCIDECGATNYYFKRKPPCSNTCTSSDCCHICKPNCDNIDENIIDLHPSSMRDGNTSYVFYDTKTDTKDLPNNMTKLILQDECEKILKQFYRIDDSDYFIIAARNTYNASRVTNQFNYSIFLSNGTKCDISLCNTTTDSKIIIQVPMNTTNKDYQNAKEYADKGIDIYDPNDPFFKDRCYPFTSTNNTDISLKDRNTDILIHPDNVCSPDCNYIGSNFTSNEVSCECTQSKKNIFTAFKSAILEANYEVVLCYKLVFTLDIFSKGNIGHYCGLVMIAFLIIDYGIFSCRNITAFNQMITSMHWKILLRIDQSRRKKTDTQSPSPIILNKNHPNLHIIKGSSDSSKITLNKIINHPKYSDEQLDNQPFKEAYENDKRSFLRILWSSTKSVQPIIYIFVKSQAALSTIKIASFLLSLMLDFALNAFFYTDKYISKAYKKGNNNSILDTFPISCYSYCLGIVVNFIFNFLSSFESMYYSLEEQKNPEVLVNLSKRYIRKYKIKLTLFIPLSLIFGVGYWYYMTAFCAVYMNSQDEWLVSCWTSFGISTIISVVISLIIALLRYYSLKKNCSCCFLIIKILLLFF